MLDSLSWRFGPLGSRKQSFPAVLWGREPGDLAIIYNPGRKSQSHPFQRLNTTAQAAAMDHSIEQSHSGMCVCAVADFCWGWYHYCVLASTAGPSLLDGEITTEALTLSLSSELAWTMDDSGSSATL